MKTETKDLKKKVNALKYATNKSDIDGFGAWIFLHEGYMFSFNGFIKISVPLDTDGVSCAVPAEEFRKFVSKASSKSMTINKWSDTEIVCEAESLKIILSNNTEILSKVHLLPSPPEKYNRISEELLVGLKHCCISYSKEEYVTNPNILIDFDTIVSTDSRRISEYQLSEELDMQVKLPGRIVEEILSNNIQFIKVTKNIVHFSTDDDVVYSCLNIEDEFPPYKKILEGVSGEILVFPEELKAMLSNMEILTKTEVLISIAKGYLTCSANNSKGFIEDNCAVDFDGFIEFKCIPKNLITALEVFEEGIVSTEREVILFENNNFTHIMQIWRN